jgi:hypothetical protein
VGVDTDTGDTGLTEVKATFLLIGLGESGLLEKCNNERSQTAVDVKGNLVFGGQLRKSGDIIDNTMGEVGCGTNKKDSVRVNQTANGMDVNLELGLRAGDTVQLDLEVVASLDECRVGGIGNNPASISLLWLRQCTGMETHISGSVTPRSKKAFCRAAKQAMRIDSVPPLVVTPAPSDGALKRAKT